jgi:hypothetical protein
MERKRVGREQTRGEIERERDRERERERERDGALLRKGCSMGG